MTPLARWRQLRSIPSLGTVNGHDGEAPDLERGAVLMILALVISILLLCAGFAVDFGYWYQRAERLQNAADAAALAGALEYNATADQGQTLARVLDVLDRNGVATGHSVQVEITWPGTLDLSTGELRVTVVDRDVDLYFSALIMDPFTIRRGATALMDTCGVSCTTTVQVPKAFNDVDLPDTPTSAGFAPIIIGVRAYAIHHHAFDPQIVCVELGTSAPCAGYPKPLVPVGTGYSNGAGSGFTASPALTDSIVHTGTYQNRLFFTVQTDARLLLGCWNSLSDSLCANGLTEIAALSGTTRGDAWRESRGGGVTVINNEVFVFTDNHDVHCRRANNLSQTCPGYATPKPHTLKNEGRPAFLGTNGTFAFSDRLVDPATKRIYVVSHYTGVDEAQGTRLHCWDANTDNTCANMPNSISIHAFGDPDASDDLRAGRLFFDRSFTTINGICSLGHEGAPTYATSHHCVPINGGATYSIPGFDAALDTSTNFVGVHHFHAASSKLMINSGFSGQPQTRCWSFATNSSCGELNFGEDTSDFGYADLPGTNCLLAFGYYNRLYSFGSDMTVGCAEGSTSTTIFPCTCIDGSQHWGALLYEGDPELATSLWLSWDVVIFAPDGSVLMTEDLILSAGRIDLSTIPMTYPYLTMRMKVVARDGVDPWSDPATAPTVTFGWSDKPYLVS